MTFFDIKEEVIDIELTPYGKSLLSQGKWKPVYYEFYDDDVVYDSQYAGFQENQDDTKKRIKETPRQKAQYSFEGAETRYKRFLKNRSNKNDIEMEPERRNNFFLSSLPLGTSDVSFQYYPSLELSCLSGKIQSTVQEQIQQISRSTKVKGLPSSLYQINMEDQKYTISFRGKEQQSQAEEFQQDTFLKQVEEQILEEEVVEITLERGYFLFDISELGIVSEKENFEIFLYEIAEDARTGETIEKPLQFKKDPDNIINNIYVEPSEMERVDYSITNKHVEKYFDVACDKEISNEVLCKHLSLEQIQLLNATQGYGLKCSDANGIMISNKELLIASSQMQDVEDC